MAAFYQNVILNANWNYNMLNGCNTCPNDESAHQQKTDKANAKKDFELSFKIMIF